MVAISTADFPQADRIKQVGQVASAVANGKHADAEIERFIGLDSGGRQGRYYRLAAELLGLVENHGNFAVLTPAGEEYASLSTDAARVEYLAMRLVETPVFREALAYIDRVQPSDQQLKLWFRQLYPGAQGTADRRFSTFMSYLHDADLLNSKGSANQVRRFKGGMLKRPGKPRPRPAGGSGDIAPSEERQTVGDSLLRVDVDLQKRERANRVHWRLIDAKSAFVADHGLDPFDNQNIDLFADDHGDVIFYEMKSVTPDCSNLLTQVRKAVSQLYEYRYVYNEPSARLCIVTNQPMLDRDAWLSDYLVKDRSIAYEWTTDFTSFHCEEQAAALLGGYAPV